MSQNRSERPAVDVSVRRERHSLVALTLGQFFVGGLVLFITSSALMMMMLFTLPTAEYDGIMSILGVGISAVVIAAPSMVVAMVVGLPLRLVPAARSRWLARGELTVAGAGVGFIVCAAVIAVMAASDAEAGALPGSDLLFWALIAGWALFTISVAHFVWPVRWKRLTKI